MDSNLDSGRPRALETILQGGIAVAVLDIANAMTFWWFYNGASPEVILQSIAAGLLGPDAFSGGMPTALLGAFLHFFISCGIAAVFWFACQRMPILFRRPVTYGAIYGVIVYLVMTYVVVPLSQATPVPFIPSWFLTSVLGHIVLVGIPVGLIARRSAACSQAS
ncbi:MAG: hypothetical protein ACRER4_03180 [Steroidobacteraceae bacterium]